MERPKPGLCQGTVVGQRGIRRLKRADPASNARTRRKTSYRGLNKVRLNVRAERCSLKDRPWCPGLLAYAQGGGWGTSPCRVCRSSSSQCGSAISSASGDACLAFRMVRGGTSEWQTSSSSISGGVVQPYSSQKATTAEEYITCGAMKSQHARQATNKRSARGVVRSRSAERWSKSLIWRCAKLESQGLRSKQRSRVLTPRIVQFEACGKRSCISGIATSNSRASLRSTMR